MKKQLITLILSMFFVSQMFAQFTMTGEFRPRTEYSHGYKSLAGEDTQFTLATSQRTRLNLDYKSEGYRFFVSLQDIRIWGDEPQLVSFAGDHTALHQAFAEVYLNNDFTLKAGRQEIIYDDHRIFGSVGWAPQARSHDATIFKYARDDFKADFGLAFNLYASAAPSYKAFQYVWLQQKLGNVSISLLALNNGNTDDADATKIKYSQTLGTHSKIKVDKFFAALNAYYQGGKTSADAKVNAYLLGLDIGYKLSDAFSLGAGFEQQSGNDMSDDNGEQNAFTPFYGTNHKFNGHMDYFYVGNHVGSVGLNDYHVKLGFKKGKFGAKLAAHYFMSAGEILNESGDVMEDNLGTEFDLSVGFPIAKGVGFSAGYSQMFGTESMVVLKGGSTDAISNWSWMMITIKPELFTTKK